MQKAKLARRMLFGILAVAAIPAIFLWTGPLLAGPESGIVPSLGTHCIIQVGGRTARVRADGTWSVTATTLTAAASVGVNMPE